jgi:ureidoglycolate lyase
MVVANPVPLTRATFAPYGAVIETSATQGRTANDGRALRFDQEVGLAHGLPACDPALALYRVEPSRLPLTVEYLERHPASSQVFVPMTAARYLVVTAGPSADGGPSLESLRAFVATSAQGVCYGPGVWHYPLVSLDRAATFAMFMWQAPDAAEDCEVHRLDAPVEVASPDMAPTAIRE